jgi:hypothetical protein
MKRPTKLGLIGLVAASSMLVAACGSSSRSVGQATTTVTKTVTVPPAATATTPATPPPKPTGCDELGINATQLHEGKCVGDGYHYNVVNKASTLRMKTLTVNLAGIRTTDALSDPNGMDSKTADGKFVVVTLNVTNRTHAPAAWQSDQTLLALGNGTHTDDQYSESFNAENGADQNSCLWKVGGALNGSLQPGMSATCDVVFDVPAHAKLERTGSNLVVADLGTDVNSASTFGLIRTYH